MNNNRKKRKSNKFPMQSLKCFQSKPLFFKILLAIIFLFNLSSQQEIINISNYNYPKVSETQKDEFLLAVLGTNDIHGQAYERDFKTGNETYKAGGYKLLSGAIKKIREEFKDQFLWLDAGDQFTGTVENVNTTGKMMVDFYNALRVDSVAIGNHEWDNKESQLKEWMAKELGRYSINEHSFFNFADENKNLKNAKNKEQNNENATDNGNNGENLIENKELLMNNLQNLQQMFSPNNSNSFLQTDPIPATATYSEPAEIPKSTKFLEIEESASASPNPFTRTKTNNLYLAANLQLKDSFNKTIDDLPNRMSTKIFEFLNGKIKIGIIGLTTIETFEKTGGFPNKKFDILSYKPVVERFSKELKAKGATAVLIVSHVGMTCKSPLFTPDQVEEYYKLALRDINTYTGSNETNACKGEMFDLLQSLEPGTIQGVIGGHIHESIHHFINGIPVIQNPMSNIFTNVLYLKFKKDENGNYYFNKEKSVIEGPIPLCSKIYTNNLRCNIFQDLTDNTKLSEFSFHGGKFDVDPSVQGVFDKYQSLNEEIERMKQNIIFKTEIRLERSNTDENILGNLVADMNREMTKADIGMVAPGNLRYIWEKGHVSEYELNNMFPFGGNFGKYNVTGANLKRILQVLQEGKSGFYSFSGVNMTIIRYNETYAKLDMGSVKLWTGETIQDDKMYSFASNEFELLGGDDMKNFLINGKISINASVIEDSKPILANFNGYLKNLQVLKELDQFKYLGRLKIVYLNNEASAEYSFEKSNESFNNEKLLIEKPQQEEVTILGKSDLNDINEAKDKNQKKKNDHQETFLGV